MKIKTLITTSLELNENKKLNNFLFAGDWCFKDKKFFQNDKKIFNNIWDSQKEINKDYFKIKKIHKKINNELSNYFFHLHEKKISKKIWKNLLFVWLTYYLFFYYFKWKTISIIFKKNKKLNFINYKVIKNTSHLDSLDFYNISSTSDIFNYLAFKKIILYKKKRKLIKVKILKKKNTLKDNQITRKKSQKKLKFSTLKKMIIFFQINFLNPKLLILDGINFKLSLLINLFSFQFPLIFKDVFEWEKEKIKIKDNVNKIKSQKLKIKGSEFEKFVMNNIFDDIPLCFTSGFKHLNALSEKIKLDPRVIISGTQHIHNELAKLWILKQKYIKNKKLFVVSHGGGHQNLSLTMYDYEHKIGNYFFQWLDKKTFFNFRLPNTKYLFNIKKRIKNSEKIVFVGNELKSYINRISPGPMSISSANAIKDLEIICQNVDTNIKSKIFYAPKKKMINFFFEKLSKILNKKQILPNSELDTHIKLSKLVICTYPQTTFFDAIMSGPTILVYNPKLWKQYKELDKPYKFLKENNIIFDNPKDAANHINNIWKDIDEWWLKEDVINARNMFLKEFNLPPKNNFSDIFKCLKIFKNV